MLKSAGFSEKIELSHWHEAWRERKHAQVIGSDGSIMEITRADEYIRIVALSKPGSAHRPFGLYWYRSHEHPERPKTDFHLSNDPPVCMSAASVARIIECISKGKRLPWWTWIVNSRLDAIVATYRSVVRRKTKGSPA